jgi:hypothetical protein
VRVVEEIDEEFLQRFGSAGHLYMNITGSTSTGSDPERAGATRRDSRRAPTSAIRCSRVRAGGATRDQRRAGADPRRRSRHIDTRHREQRWWRPWTGTGCSACLIILSLPARRPGLRLLGWDRQHVLVARHATLA